MTGTFRQIRPNHPNAWTEFRLGTKGYQLKGTGPAIEQQLREYVETRK